MKKLTQQEEEIMLHIWNLETCFVKDVLARIPAPQPPYTTVASIINNLKHKGYVVAKRMGNSYMYTPAIQQSEYKRNFIGDVVYNYFSNSYKEMVSFFTKDEKLSVEDLKEIIDLIEKGNKQSL